MSNTMSPVKMPTFSGRGDKRTQAQQPPALTEKERQQLQELSKFVTELDHSRLDWKNKSTLQKLASLPLQWVKTGSLRKPDGKVTKGKVAAEVVLDASVVGLALILPKHWGHMRNAFKMGLGKGVMALLFGFLALDVGTNVAVASEAASGVGAPLAVATDVSAALPEGLAAELVVANAARRRARKMQELHGDTLDSSLFPTLPKGETGPKQITFTPGPQAAPAKDAPAVPKALPDADHRQPGQDELR